MSLILLQNVLFLLQTALDIEGVTWLEGWLAGHRGAAVVVSHDRFFIDKVATRLLVFGEGGVRLVEGNWTTWQALRERRRTPESQPTRPAVEGKRR
jgi:ATPase subunit of ABC transporter with duplicated ATPase domains